MLRQPSGSTLFPYTTLFRSIVDLAGERGGNCELTRPGEIAVEHGADRKSTRLNSSHVESSYAVFCLKKKKNQSCAVRFAVIRIRADCWLPHRVFLLSLIIIL